MERWPRGIGTGLQTLLHRFESGTLLHGFKVLTVSTSVCRTEGRGSSPRGAANSLGQSIAAYQYYQVGRGKFGPPLHTVGVEGK